MKHQGKRSDITSTQVGQKLKNKYSIEQLAEDVGNTRTQIQRFIRLTELIEPLRDMVDGLRSDGKKIAFNPAVELSYLSKENQQLVVKNIEGLDLTPSHAQTIRMKELSRENRLDENVIYSIMTEEKANQKEKLSFKMEDINEYFPKNYTPRQKEEIKSKKDDSYIYNCIFCTFYFSRLSEGGVCFLWGNVTRFSPKNPFPVILLEKVILV